MTASSNYPSLLARVLGQRNTINGTKQLHWRGYTWTRWGAVWIPHRSANLQLDLQLDLHRPTGA